MSNEIRDDIVEAINNGSSDEDIASSFGVTTEEVANIRGEIASDNQPEGATEAGVEAQPEVSTDTPAPEGDNTTVPEEDQVNTEAQPE